MKRGRADDEVRDAAEREGSEVGAHQLDPLAVARTEAQGGPVQHVLRPVDTDHASQRQPFEQHRGEPSGAATGVDDGLVAPQRDPLQHREPPAVLRIAQPFVRPGIPLARH